MPSIFNTNTSKNTYQTPIIINNEQQQSANDIISNPEFVSLDYLNYRLNQVLLNTGGDITGDLVFSENRRIILGSDQQVSFTAVKDDILTNLNTKNTDISYNGGITTINNDLNIIGDLTLSSNLNTGDIGNGDVDNTKLSFINSLSSNAQTQINNLNTLITTNTNNISNSSSLITDNTNDITTINDTISLISKDENTTTIANDIVLDDVIINNSLAVDGTFIISNGTYEITDSQFSYLKNLDSDIKTDLLSLQSQITTNSNTNTSLQGQITTNTTDILTKQDIINDTDNKLPIDNVDLTGSNLVYADYGSSINTKFTSLDGQITTNIADILTKQDTINNTDSKLPIDHVDLTGSNLVYADYGSSINTKFTALDGQISTLTGLQDGDIVSFTEIDNQLTDLYANKQDTIDTNNKLSMVFVGTGEVNDTKLNYIKNITGDLQTSLDLKANLASPTFTGTVSGIDKTMVGLTNVDNTSDANKPVSTAQQTALDLKANLNAPTFTGTVSGIDKTMVGLTNVDNTSDSNKPVSTAQQTALDLKADLIRPEFTGIIENMSNTYTFSSNVLTYDYTNGSVIFFNGLTSATNFELVLTNVNSNNDTYKSFTVSLIIDTGTYQAFANTCKINGTSRTIYASGGLTNVSIDASSEVVLQQLSIIFSNSGTVPFKVISSVSSIF